MLRLSWLIKVFLAIFILSIVCTYSLAANVEMPGQDDRCPVCGMFVAPYTDWVATIVFEDGRQLFFDGCKDMFRYYFKHSVQHDNALEGMKGIYVTDYYSTRLVPVEDVFFVVGSDVYGPMGHELIPIVGEDLAQTFSRDHGGAEIYRFKQISIDNLPAN